MENMKFLHREHTPHIFVRYSTSDVKNNLKKKITHYPLILQTTHDTFKYHYGQKNIGCIIIEVDNHNFNSLRGFLIENTYTFRLPVICIVQGENRNYINQWKGLGISRIIHYTELNNIDKITTEHFNITRANLKLETFHIAKHVYPSHNIQKTLDIIEANYINISKIAEISDIININENTLTQKFGKHNLYSPKWILMNMKLYHAIHLMQFPCYSLKEIAGLSGFSDYQSFRRWTKHILNQPPSQIHETMQNSGAKTVMNTTLKKIKNFISDN